MNRRRTIIRRLLSRGIAVAAILTLIGVVATGSGSAKGSTEATVTRSSAAPPQLLGKWSRNVTAAVKVGGIAKKRGVWSIVIAKGGGWSREFHRNLRTRRQPKVSVHRQRHHRHGEPPELHPQLRLRVRILLQEGDLRLEGFREVAGVHEGQRQVSSTNRRPRGRVEEEVTGEVPVTAGPRSAR